MHDWAHWKAYRAGYLRACKDAGMIPRVDADTDDHIWNTYAQYLFDQLERAWAHNKREQT